MAKINKSKLNNTTLNFKVVEIKQQNKTIQAVKHGGGGMFWILFKYIFMVTDLSKMIK